MEEIMELAIRPGSISTKSVWTGRVISALVGLFLLFDSIAKLMMLDAVVKGSAQIGYPAGVIWIIGLILLACTIIYVNPKTSILGAVLLTGYLGGAVASNLRVEAPIFSNILFPVYFGILIWAGLYLRNPQLRRIIQIIRNG